MNQDFSHDPRSIRARKLLSEAFIDLLKEVDYKKISISKLVEKAGLSRPAFYNHFESKTDFLYYLISQILDPYFEKWDGWNQVSEAAIGEERVGKSFFEMWERNSEVFELLGNLDLDCLLIGRLQSYFNDLYISESLETRIGLPPELAEYFASFNAHTFVSFLRVWIDNRKNKDPHQMGKLLYHFTDPTIKLSAIEKFKDVFDGAN